MKTVRTNDRTQKIKNLTGAAVFCAIAYASEFVFHFKISHLSFDIKDSIIAIAAMIFGPVYAIFMGVAVATLEAFTISTTGWYGWLMNVLSTVTFTAIASFIYKYKKTLMGAVLGLLTGAVSMTAIMLLANIFITPAYLMSLGIPASSSDIIADIPLLYFPFNILKAIFNSAIAMMLYKHVVSVLRRVRVLPRQAFHASESKKTSVLRSVCVTGVAMMIAVVAVVILIVGLGATIERGI